jgi:hypothetical protein
MPLNPGLYDLLRREFRGKVRIGNPGMRLRYRLVSRPEKPPLVQSLGGGEEYLVDCPLCGDRRQRCSINHAFGTEVDGIEVRHLIHCFNEDCRGLSDWLLSLLESQKWAKPLPYLPREASPTENPSAGAAADPRRLAGISRLDNLPADHPAVAYVAGRGFDPAYLARHFGVGYTGEGWEWTRRRLLAPVFFSRTEVGWCARAIPGHSRLTLVAPGKSWPYREPKYLNARGFSKSRFLYNLDQAQKHEVLTIAEGITDVWKIGVWGVALLGKAMSAEQRRLLCQAAEGKKAWLVLLGDASTESDDAAAAWLENYRALRSEYRYPGRIRLHLFERGDPGDLASSELHRLIEEILHDRA